LFSVLKKAGGTRKRIFII